MIRPVLCFFIPPPRGEGGRERKRATGWGVFITSMIHPTPLLAALGATLPIKGREDVRA